MGTSFKLIGTGLISTVSDGQQDILSAADHSYVICHGLRRPIVRGELYRWQ